MGLLWEPMLPRLARASDLARYSRTCDIMVVFSNAGDAGRELQLASSNFCTSIDIEYSIIIEYHILPIIIPATRRQK